MCPTKRTSPPPRRPEAVREFGVELERERRKMNTVVDPLVEILRRHGVQDAEAFLLEKGEDAGIQPSADPDVQMRGSIQLMKKRMVSRDEVDEGLGSLKFL